MIKKYLEVFRLIYCLCFTVITVSCSRVSRFATGEIKYGTSADAYITDSQGRVVAIPEKIEKTIILNSNCYAMLQVIGAAGTVIGTQFTNFKKTVPDLQNFGTWTAPSVERIIEATPDAVIAYSNRIPAESVRQIEDAGITLVFFDFYVPSDTAREIIELGRLYRNEGAAKEYTAFLDEYYRLIKDRLSGIKNENRKTIYFESYGDYASVSRGSGAQELIDAALCVNIAAGEPVPYPKVSDEWILGHDPGIIVKCVSTNAGIMGPGITDTTGAEKFYTALLNRSGWSGLSAVKARRFILMYPGIAASPEGGVIGALVIAKLAYPDLFQDIDPLEIYAGMQSRFFAGKNSAGLLVYP
jgi:iron complex transport system substrate-binding protein